MKEQPHPLSAASARPQTPCLWYVVVAVVAVVGVRTAAAAAAAYRLHSQPPHGAEPPNGRSEFYHVIAYRGAVSLNRLTHLVLYRPPSCSYLGLVKVDRPRSGDERRRSAATDDRRKSAM
jgi:hypothetical protein